MTLSKEAQAKIDAWITRYPKGEQRSAVIPALHILQEENGGYLTPDHIKALANYLSLPHIAVHEVASFYSMYDLAPVGKHKIKICGSVSCLLRGADVLIAHIKERYNIDIGGTTEDERFTLKRVECLGACVDAPVVQIGKVYHEKQTPDSLVELMEKLP